MLEMDFWYPNILKPSQPAAIFVGQAPKAGRGGGRPQGKVGRGQAPGQGKVGQARGQGKARPGGAAPCAARPQRYAALRGKPIASTGVI